VQEHPARDAAYGHEQIAARFRPASAASN
jgi:hypothetical protein